MGGVFMKIRWKILLVAAVTFVLLAAAWPLRAQDSTPPRKITVWVNEKTGELFIRPGRGRVKLTGILDTGDVEQRVEQKIEQKTENQVRTAVAESRAQQAADNAVLTKQVAEMKPAWTS